MKEAGCAVSAVVAVLFVIIVGLTAYALVTGIRFLSYCYAHAGRC